MRIFPFRSLRGRPKEYHKADDPKFGDLVLAAARNPQEIDPEMKTLVERRQRTIEDEERITRRPIFSPPYKPPAVRDIEVTREELFAYIRRQGQKIAINDVTGVVFFHGRPMEDGEVLAIVNRVRQTGNLAPFSIKANG